MWIKSTAQEIIAKNGVPQCQHYLQPEQFRIPCSVPESCSIPHHQCLFFMYQILLNEQNDIGDIIYAETESTWSVKNTVHMSITLFINDVMGRVVQFSKVTLKSLWGTHNGISSPNLKFHCIWSRNGPSQWHQRFWPRLAFFALFLDFKA